MLCLCHHGPALLRFWFQTDLGAKIHPVQAGQTFSYHGHALVTLYVQFLYSDWSKFDGWVYVENLCSILKNVYFDSWSWQSFESTCDVCNCLFPLDVKNEYSCYQEYSLSHGWFVYCVFGWEMLRFSKPIIRFRMASMASFLFFTLLDAYGNFEGSSDPCLTW